MYDKTTFLSGLAMGLCGKGNPTFEGSGKMLYNGVELPALPVVGYPYVAVVNRYFGNYSSPIRTQAYFTSAPATYEEDGYSYGDNVTYAVYQIDWGEDEKEWKLVSSGTADNYSISIPSVVLTKRWANHNILDGTDGSLYLAASEPVPVEDAFTKGYHVGAALRRKRRLPVAYSYGGYTAPALPAGDDEEYPHAYICTIWYDFDSNKVHLIRTNVPMAVSNDWISALGVYGTATKHYIFDPDTHTDWVLSGESTVLLNGQTTYLPQWANTDMAAYTHAEDATGKNVYTPKGTVGLAASDPVPVYE